MARFVLASSGLDQTVTLQAMDGDELSLEEVQAWAAVRAATALDTIAQNLDGIAARLDGVEDALGSIATGVN
jgi:hypothetical protein